MNRGHWFPYILIGLVANGAIGGAAYLYLEEVPPTYTSQWTVTLPSLGSSTNVNLPDIGGTSSSVQSPYSGGAGDPRENYKFIAASEPVRREAAEALNMTTSEFGKPTVSVIDNSTLIRFELEGDSPEQARNKSLALHNAFEARLNQLRVQEAVQKEEGLAEALKSAQGKLEESQRKLSEYKARTGLASELQIGQLSTNIEALRKERAELIAQQQQTTARLNQLSANLKLTAPEATDAFVLKADPLLEQYRQAYSEATSTLTVLSAKYGPNHPAVLRERSRQESAQAALLARSEELIGKSVNPTSLAQLNLGSSTQTATARESLFQELVKAQVEQQGLQAGAAEIDQQITQLEERLNLLAQYNSNVDALRRDLQISEAVFSSTLASLDVGKTNLFGSYPRIQLLTEPSLPSSPTSPKKEYAILGAALGSLLIDTGLVSLWLRQRWLRKRKALKTAETVDYLSPETRQLRSDNRTAEVLDLRKNI